MIGLSVITNFDSSKVNLFKLPNRMKSISSDIDFDFVDFILKNNHYSKLCVSGGTDPLDNLNDHEINIEVLKGLALKHNIRFFIYTRFLNNYKHFIRYIKPNKLVIINQFICKENEEQVREISNICPIRLYIDYNRQKSCFINIWQNSFRGIKNLEFCVKQNKYFIGKQLKKIHRKVYVADKGDYNSYLMPDNRLYCDFNSTIQYRTKFDRDSLINKK